MSALAEVRVYSTSGQSGWAIRLGVIQLRWNRQQNYLGLSLEVFRHSDFLVGGMTWKEFRAARIQQKADKLAARQAAELLITPKDPTP